MKKLLFFQPQLFLPLWASAVPVKSDGINYILIEKADPAVKKLKFILLFFFIFLCHNLIIAQDLKNQITVTLVSLSSENTNGISVEKAGLVIKNNSNSNIIINNYIASKTETNEPFFYINPANVIIQANSSVSLTIIYNGGNFLMMGGWTFEFGYTNYSDMISYIKKVQKPANYFSSNMVLDDVDSKPEEDEIINGEFAKNLKWNYRKSTRTLTITGHGSMNIYGEMPWEVYKDKIEEIIIL